MPLAQSFPPTVYISSQTSWLLSVVCFPFWFASGGNFHRRLAWRGRGYAACRKETAPVRKSRSKTTLAGPCRYWGHKIHDNLWEQRKLEAFAGLSSIGYRVSRLRAQPRRPSFKNLRHPIDRHLPNGLSTSPTDSSSKYRRYTSETIGSLMDITGSSETVRLAWHVATLEMQHNSGTRTPSHRTHNFLPGTRRPDGRRNNQYQLN